MSLRRGFVLRFEAAVDDLARQAAASLRARLDGSTSARIETGEPASGRAPGLAMRVGVRDDDGEPRWLAPIPVRDEPEGAAEDAVSFLERWGFLPRQRLSRRDVRVS